MSVLTCIADPPKHWKRPGKPTCTYADEIIIAANVRPCNVVMHSSWRWAHIMKVWQYLVKTALPLESANGENDDDDKKIRLIRVMVLRYQELAVFYILFTLILNSC